MKLQLGVVVWSVDHLQPNGIIDLSCEDCKSDFLENKEVVAYPSLINSHDHLIGNWFPKAGDHRPYPNSHIWVEDMKHSDSILERNLIWFNDGSFDLLAGNAPLLAMLGCYKNVFAGCAAVQDHGPKQESAYYDMFPINVVREYKQCHSLTLGNWWGGLPPVEEWKASHGKVPFIIHLGEGTDEATAREFDQLVKLGLLQPNTMLIHAIALRREELKACAQAGTSLCWCPDSNHFLIGKTLDIYNSLALGVNVVIGTDSTITGGINLLEEMRFAKRTFQDIESKEILRMVTENAARALFLPEQYGSLERSTDELLLTDKLVENAYDNILLVHPVHIQLLLHEGKPVFGDRNWLECFETDESQYSFFMMDDREKFVVGNPLAIKATIDAILGYKKNLPYLPF